MTHDPEGFLRDWLADYVHGEPPNGVFDQHAVREKTSECQRDAKDLGISATALDAAAVAFNHLHNGLEDGIAAAMREALDAETRRQADERSGTSHD